jgi:acyl-CoA reductase-like NAD-dependent aldehyde dehydrogenase
MTSLSTRTTHPMLIGGEFRDASDGATIDAFSPSTGEVLGTFPAGTSADVDAAVAAAETAFRDWRRTEATERAALVQRLAAAIEEHAEEFARLDAADNGSLLTEICQLLTPARC